jgi:hypothetical protein
MSVQSLCGLAQRLFNTGTSLPSLTLISSKVCLFYIIHVPNVNLTNNYENPSSIFSALHFKNDFIFFFQNTTLQIPLDNSLKPLSYYSIEEEDKILVSP